MYKLFLIENHIKHTFYFVQCKQLILGQKYFTQFPNDKVVCDIGLDFLIII